MKTEATGLKIEYPKGALFFRAENQPIMLFFSGLLWLLFNHLHLANDGIELLRLTLTSHQVFIVSAARLHAYWILEWPVKLGMIVGLQDLKEYIILYGAAIFVMYATPWVLANFRIRDRKEFSNASILYLLALGAVTFPSTYLLGTEHQTIVPLAFTAGILLARFDEGATAWNTLAIIVLFLLCKTYETNLIPLSFFGCYLAHGLLSKRQNKVNSMLLMLGLVVCIYGVYVSAGSIIHPREPAHRAGFLQHITYSFKNPVFLTFLFCAMAILAFQRIKIAAGIILGLGFVFQAYCLYYPSLYAEAAQLSFASRSLTLFLPGLLVLLLLGHVKFESNGWLRWGMSVVLVIAVVFLSLPFLDYKEQVTAVGRKHKGFVPAEVHHLGHHPASWCWTFPSLSIAWQTPCVSTILLNPYLNHWQPYSPENNSGFGRYVAFAPWFYPDDGQVRRCQPLHVPLLD